MCFQRETILSSLVREEEELDDNYDNDSSTEVLTEKKEEKQGNSHLSRNGIAILDKTGWPNFTK